MIFKTEELYFLAEKIKGKHFKFFFYNYFQMNLSKINFIARGNQMSYVKLSDLIVGEMYKIVKIRKVTTKYGVKVAVEYNTKSYSYLPNRLSKSLVDDETAYQYLDNQIKTEDIHLRYLGGRFNPVEFININDQLQDQGNLDGVNIEIAHEENAGQGNENEQNVDINVNVNEPVEAQLFVDEFML